MPDPGYEFGIDRRRSAQSEDHLRRRTCQRHHEDHVSERAVDQRVARTSTRLSRCGRSATSRSVFSPTNPHELLAGFQYLMATTDGGAHWKKLSPDLGYPKGVTPPPRDRRRAGGRGGRGRPWCGGAAAAACGGPIESLSRPRALRAGVIWVGTNNGLIKVTKNHGLTWDDVTIPDLPNPTRADISTIDASHHDAGDGVRRHRLSRLRRLHAVALPDARLRQDVDEDRQRDAHRSAERELRARDPGGHQEGGTALCRHRELDVRLVRRRRRLAVADAQSAEHVVPRHRRSRTTISSSARTGAASGSSTTSRRCGR